ncbi:hypothetical protein LTR62_004444 [Meristemomyces frigidus]|uniref:N-acetylgalactosaminide beta-1,3-galactosyltransferase n=1 Tax=Meristemomyces frigidus TaxID=1508187 RepID=A0AAN7YP48_9PEZI|nr:hypothetical protein LTR62_004444 [Meristemomyces frigidus]
MRLPIWRLALGVAFAGSIVGYLFWSYGYAPLTAELLEHLPKPAVHEAAPQPNNVSAKSYSWSTVTAFPLIDSRLIENATRDELCRHFPHDKLRDIQPVLKTGHGVIDRARHSLNSTSACLSNIIIFSDLAHETGLDGIPVIDILADIPKALLEKTEQTLPYRELVAMQANGTLSTEKMSNLEGWRTDKFKFLPEVSRAWQLSPNKRWYVFYEGDTYIVWDTVFRLLDHFDPDIPHYFGSPSPGREGAWFANGGPGYILSRGAVRALVKTDWDSRTGEWLGPSLTVKYFDDILGMCCGDDVLGWVLAKSGILLKGLWPMFNPHNLHGVPFSDLYWCQPVLSLHKSTETDSVDLWRWEWNNRNPSSPATYRDIATTFFDFANMTRREDWDNGEWDAYRPAPENAGRSDESVSDCSRACENAEGCFQWTYHLRQCYFVRSFRYGRSKQPVDEEDRPDREWTFEEQRFTAGWDVEKIVNWMDARPCDNVDWVKPSLERIF